MSDRRAVTSVPIHELLAGRWSPVAFSPKPVEPVKLRSLFEAARWAASCFGDQPWVYIVATKESPSEFQKMLGVLVEGNQVWAKDAPVLALSVARKNFAHNGKENFHARHDVGAASAQLTLQAESLGLSVHQMGGYHADKAREAFSIPDDHEPVAALAIGYRGDPANLPEKLRARDEAPRQRKPLASFVFEGGFGRTSPIVK